MKKIAAFVCALALCVCIPTIAFAAQENYSPTAKQASSNGITLNFQSGIPVGKSFGDLHVEASSVQAEDIVLSADETLLANFRVYTTGDLSMRDLSKITLTFYVGEKYIGNKIAIFLEADGETVAYRNLKVGTDGTVVLSVDSVDVLSVAGPTNPVPGGGDEKDHGGTSPQTGIDFNLIAIITAVCALAAVLLAINIRRGRKVQ